MALRPTWQKFLLWESSDLKSFRSVVMFLEWCTRWECYFCTLGFSKALLTLAHHPKLHLLSGLWWVRKKEATLWWKLEWNNPLQHFFLFPSIYLLNLISDSISLVSAQCHSPLSCSIFFLCPSLLLIWTSNFPFASPWSLQNLILELGLGIRYQLATFFDGSGFIFSWMQSSWG